MTCLLIDSPPTHARWWTCVTFLPAGPSDPRYGVLRRLWADHTMNAVKPVAGGWRIGNRGGFYVQGREDQLTPALFEIWSGIDGCGWTTDLLRTWGIPHGSIRRCNWSYGWEQRADLGSRPDITDIVLCWEDEFGQGVVVVEAKRRDGSLSDKDRAGGRKYLEMPSIRPFDRKSIVFLVAERDMARVRNKLPQGAALASWEEVGRLQVRHLLDLKLPGSYEMEMAALVRSVYAANGMELEAGRPALARDHFARPADFGRIRSLGLPERLERLAFGLELWHCGRQGVLPEPPEPWLLGEPGLIDIAGLKQETSERKRLLWRLPQAVA